METKNSVRHLIFFVLSIMIAAFGCTYWLLAKNPDSFPELSVVVPIYDVEDYLPECLDSLIGQTFKNLEIICVNDGSPDNCIEILREYERKDSRIIVIDKPNGGVSSARNVGMRAAKAEYLTFVDPDDYLSTNVYEKCMYAIKNKDADILVFNSITEPDNKLTFPNLKEKFFTNQFEAIDDLDVTTSYVWNKIFRCSIIVGNNIWFNETIKFAEDNLFVNMVFPKAKTVVTCADAFYHYRIRPNSACNTLPEEKFLKDSIIRMSELIDFYIKEGYTDRYIWLLDWCLAITRHKIDNTTDIQKRKEYSAEILYILDKKLIYLIDEDIPEYLVDIMNKMKDYANI